MTSEKPSAPYNPPWTKRALVIVGVLGVALAALVATGAFRADSGPGGATGVAASETAAAETGAAAAPRPDTLVLGAQAGDLAVGLAVTREEDSLSLEATVLGQDGQPAEGLEVRIAAGGNDARGAGCGAGCYAASLAATPPATVEVRIGGGAGEKTASFELPARWEPAAELVRRATRTYRALHSVAYDEHLESRPGVAIDTRWVEEAPDRLSFRIAGGNEGIVIGERRWDREPGGRWVESPQERLSLPEPLWGGTFQNASLLGSGAVRGRPVWIVSFMTLQGLPTWFTLWIEKETGRTLELHMTTAAHFMVQRYLSFDEPASIVPPS